MDINTTLSQAIAAHQQGLLPQAKAHYEAVLQQQPRNFDALHLSGVVAYQQSDPTRALDLIQRAIHINPGHAVAYSNRGNAERALGQAERALASFERCIAMRPDYADAYSNRGLVLRELKRSSDAVASFTTAVSLQPALAPAWSNRGLALRDLGHLEPALEDFNRAISLEANYAEAWYFRAVTLLELGRWKEAKESFDRVAESGFDYPYLEGLRLHCLMQLGDWSQYAVLSAKVQERVRQGVPADLPFSFLGISDSAADQLVCARTFVNDKHPAAAQPLAQGVTYKHDRIRIAYVSADFREHAVAYLMTGLLEAHDRSRFEITAVSIGPVDDGAARKRIVGAVDRFIDASVEPDDKVARTLRELEIDIAVDLMGHTTLHRPGIFARRPAPVQVNYLGYAGTTGTTYHDYLLADAVVIPPGEAKHYSENIAWLPECFMPRDPSVKPDTRARLRADAGLPGKGFVFACFNNGFKLNPGGFSVWMRLLKQVEGSVLWLQRQSPEMVANLTAEAARQGVEASRLVFATREPTMEGHFARLRLADLFLDTFPYNAHTTASDALWAGLPVVTWAGQTFASRVAASLLTAIGLPELVAKDVEGYEALALRLARSPDELAGLRSRLDRNRSTRPLFDVARLTRHVESAFVHMHGRQQRGEAPAAFNVTAAG